MFICRAQHFLEPSVKCLTTARTFISFGSVCAVNKSWGLVKKAFLEKVWLESRAVSRTEYPVHNDCSFPAQDSKVNICMGLFSQAKSPSAGALCAARAAFLLLEGWLNLLRLIKTPLPLHASLCFTSARGEADLEMFGKTFPGGSCSSGCRARPRSNPAHVLCASERSLPSSMAVAAITQIICSTVTSSQRCRLKLKIHVKTRDVTLLSRQFRPELVSQCLDSLPTCSEELSQGTRGCLALQLTAFHLKHHCAVEIQASNSLGFNLSTFYGHIDAL